jgi:hypothetical protein
MAQTTVTTRGAPVPSPIFATDLEPLGERIATEGRIYQMLDLTVLDHEDGRSGLKWALGADLCGDSGPLPPGNYHTRDR